MEWYSIEIDVKAADPAIAGVFASEIADILRGIEEAEEIALHKVDQGTQDLGSIVRAIVTSAALTVLAGGAAKWIEDKGHVEVIVKVDGRTLEIKGDAHHIERIFKEFVDDVIASRAAPRPKM